MKFSVSILFIFLFFLSCGKTKVVSSSTVDTDNQNIIAPEVSQSGYTGVDIEGQTRTCIDQSANMMCTMEFTPSDSFANKCTENGKKAIMCACHDWICVK